MRLLQKIACKRGARKKCRVFYAKIGCIHKLAFSAAIWLQKRKIRPIIFLRARLAFKAVYKIGQKYHRELVID